MTPIPRILCVSLNPAIDRRIVLHELRMGKVNRATSANPMAGGKAAHVAFAAAALGADVSWLAFLGGPEGENCRAGVEALGVKAVVVPIASRTRTNLELIEESTGSITEVLEPGPSIRKSESELLIRQFTLQIADQPIVVLSGSLPGDLLHSFYAELIKLAKAAGCAVLLDTSGEALAQGLAASPDLIKPNRDEASAILSRKIISIDDATDAARELQRRGSRTVIVSLGADGAVVREGGEALHGVPPPVSAVSTVGSGDSFLAGWAVGLVRKLPLDARLRLAIGSGTANCLAESPGLISRQRAEEFGSKVRIQALFSR